MSGKAALSASHSFTKSRTIDRAISEREFALIGRYSRDQRTDGLVPACERLDGIPVVGQAGHERVDALLDLRAGPSTMTSSVGLFFGAAATCHELLKAQVPPASST